MSSDGLSAIWSSKAAGWQDRRFHASCGAGRPGLLKAAMASHPLASGFGND